MIDFDSFVDVSVGAPDDAAKAAIHLQLKSALGALREQGIGIQDRDAQDNLANLQLTRTTLTIAGTSNAVDRVRFHYHDTALVEKGTTVTGPIGLTLLYGDFVANASQLIPICSDDQTTDGDSLWYHYQPGLPQCAAAISAEQRAIDSAQQGLDATKQISSADAGRRFLTTRATLAPQAAAPDKWPEHDQLWGFAGDPSRQKIVVYSFFGVNANDKDPADDGLVEYLRFERYLRRAMPSLHVTETNPQAMLLDFYIDGQKLPNITWDDVESWVVDGTGFPAAVGSDATKRAALLQQVQQAFTDRWIVWTAQATATKNGVSRTMTIEIRTWHGLEDGSDDIRLHARWRYLEAFWNADVFAYTGHSHFGHGPLEPWEYSGANFPDRYQVMLINSCLSFNYYDVDFLRMHPEGSRKLDVVVNGLPAYWMGMGEATAGYVTGLLGGQQSYRQLLTGMVVDLPWQSGYDPMRAVNGELDNAYTPASGALTISY
ncbi:MAG: hypothetical protein ACM31C_00935 [Acidobacteriota bacterium]